MCDCELQTETALGGTSKQSSLSSVTSVFVYVWNWVVRLWVVVDLTAQAVRIREWCAYLVSSASRRARGAALGIHLVSKVHVVSQP